MTKTKTVQKTTYMWHLGSKSQTTGQESGTVSKEGPFVVFFILSHFIMQKYH